MKCVCGYEHKEEYNNGITVAVVGDEEFIYIDVKATRTSSGYYSDLIDVDFYACPKCGTLRCDRW